MKSFDYKVVVSNFSENTRADIVLSKELKVSRSSLQNRISEKIKVNGIIRSISYKVSPGDIIEFSLKEVDDISLQPENIPLDIIFEDPYLIAINKQPGLTVHAGGGTKCNTLVNGLLYYWKDWSAFPDKVRPGIIHRLDKDTSGVILVAKTPLILEQMQEQFSKRTVKKEYRALIMSNIHDEEIWVEEPIGRSPFDRKKMMINGIRARSAKTLIRVIERLGDYCYVSASPVTGRTHQIRVHLQHIKHPIIGDSVYGASNVLKEKGVKRQMLHAYNLTFLHPVTFHEMSLVAPLAQDMESVLSVLRNVG